MVCRLPVGGPAEYLPTMTWPSTNSSRLWRKAALFPDEIPAGAADQPSLERQRHQVTIWAEVITLASIYTDGSYTPEKSVQDQPEHAGWGKENRIIHQDCN